MCRTFSWSEAWLSYRTAGTRVSVDSVASGGHAANKQHVLGAALEPHIGSLRNEHGSYPQLYKMQRDEETWNLITARPWPLIDILIRKNGLNLERLQLVVIRKS